MSARTSALEGQGGERLAALSRCLSMYLAAFAIYAIGCPPVCVIGTGKAPEVMRGDCLHLDSNDVLGEDGDPDASILGHQEKFSLHVRQPRACWLLLWFFACPGLLHEPI